MALLTDRQLAARLVGFDSVSRHSNVPIADFACEYLDRPRVRIERVPGPEPDKVTVVASAGPEVSDRSGLVFSGHLDVVPADEPEWQSDPFTLSERDGRLFGRGASDMKGPIALMMNALTSVSAESFSAPLVLILTHDEELGCLGAQHFGRVWPADRPLPRAAVIGEPTEMKVVRMHKGHLSAQFTVRGVAAHSGSPHLGRNAIEPAARIVNRLGGLRESLAASFYDAGDFFPEVPFPVLNVSQIAGGEAINIIPESCTVKFGFRLLPGMTADEMLTRIRTIIEDETGDSKVDFEVLNDTPPLLTDEDAPIHRDLCAAVGQAESAGVSYASDGGPFNRDLDMQCVLFGPGSIDVAHKPNEYIPIDEFQRARPIYDALVQRWCVKSR